MMQFALKFPDEQIVSAVSTQLTWSHIIEVLPLKDSLQIEFYLTLASSERWGVRKLREEIDSMLYERTALSSKPDSLIRKELAELRVNHTLSPDIVFKNPYFLEFTGLKL
jgi:predicted nuclease of restriction endonuclease-like (RecB) superfamily